MPEQAVDLNDNSKSGDRPKLKRQQTVDILFTLKHVFGFDRFRGVQKAAIEAALSGKDVFVVAPTAMGKSLCFQLPAVATEHGLTVVISPLLALMSSQLRYLKEKGIKVATLNSSMHHQEKMTVFDEILRGHPQVRLLYVTPEQCAVHSFRERLRKVCEQKELHRFVIDECHCISEWGHTFRKDYLKLSYFRQEFPSIPIMALTATATEKVRNDVIENLGLGPPPRTALFMSSYNRPNLHYELRFKNRQSDPYDEIKSFIREVYERRKKRLQVAQKEDLDTPFQSTSVSGIIFCQRRQTCEDVASRLRSDGYGAVPYHAGLTSHVRETVLQKWVREEKDYNIAVATIAFGMGVDAPSVRFIVHWDLPKSLEAYYQETGRAGRDQKVSRCILYYGREDRDRRRLLLQQAQNKSKNERSSDAEMEVFESLVRYCEDTSGCRHALLCQHFGEMERTESREDFCDYACDYCKEPEKLIKEKMSPEILTAIDTPQAEEDAPPIGIPIKYAPNVTHVLQGPKPAMECHEDGPTSKKRKTNPPEKTPEASTSAGKNLSISRKEGSPQSSPALNRYPISSLVLYAGRKVRIKHELRVSTLAKMLGLLYSLVPPSTRAFNIPSDTNSEVS